MQLEDILDWMTKAGGKLKGLRGDVTQLREQVETLERQPGPVGKSAYELAVDAGFRGTEPEWRLSLHGQDAPPVDLDGVVERVLARVPEPIIPTADEIAARVVVPAAQVPSAAEIAALVPRAAPAPAPEAKPGPMGPMPDHQWDGTKLRFQKPSGWGAYVDLQGPKGTDAAAPRGYQGGPIFVEGSGGAIDDGITGTETTWSSQKIETEIANAASAPGAGNDLSYRHVQMAAAAVWSIAHNLGKYPSITVVDSAGDECEGDFVYVDVNHLTLTFSAAFAGTAYLN